MNSQTLVSIIIPVYNVAPYIEECIKSIQEQTYSRLEIIIIDDGSTDDSGEICEEFAKNDGRIQVIRQKNSGVVTARGRGVERASGKYIVFVDGDDWIEPTMVEVLMKKKRDADLVSVGVFEHLANGKTAEKLDRFMEGYYSKEKKISEIFKRMIYDKHTGKSQVFTPWIWNKLYLCDLVKKVYQEMDATIKFAEDSVFLYKYVLHCRSIVIDHQCFYHYRYRKESAIHSVNPCMLMDINRVYLALADDFRNHEAGSDLLFQLQKWVSRTTCLALNYHMGFDERACVPEFIADISGLEGKKIVVYGAGKMGQMAYKQLNRFGYSVVLWVDKAYEDYRGKEMEVMPPEEIHNKEYDVLLIAVSREDVVEKIKDELKGNGVPEEKILWKKPMSFF